MNKSEPNLGVVIYKEKDLFDYILVYKERNDGISPTFRGISEATGIGLAYVRDALEELESAGKIILGAYKRPRHIKVVGGRWVGPDNQVDGKG